jgi:hypothetical protein
LHCLIVEDICIQASSFSKLEHVFCPREENIGSGARLVCVRAKPATGNAKIGMRCEAEAFQELRVGGRVTPTPEFCSP